MWHAYFTVDASQLHLPMVSFVPPSWSIYSTNYCNREHDDFFPLAHRTPTNTSKKGASGIRHQVQHLPWHRRLVRCRSLCCFPPYHTVNQLSNSVWNYTANLDRRAWNMFARNSAHVLMTMKRHACGVHPSVPSRASSLLLGLRRSSSGEPFPITGTLPTGGKGVAVSQYAEVSCNEY